MATAGQSDFQCTGSWADIGATIAAVISTDTVIQCLDLGGVQVVFGGGTAPTGKSGVILSHLDSMQGNAANIWVRALDGSGAVSVTTI